MKTLFTAFRVIALLLIPLCSFAQTGTVVLKDGNGATLSAHASIQAAYNAIPVPLTQPYRIEIDYLYNSDQETFPIVFTEKAGAGPNHIITIVPNPNSSPIAANVGGRTDLSPLLVFDGADWITINGYRPGSIPWSMGFVDYTPSSTTPLPAAIYPTVSFINGASHNVLMYCNFSNNSDDYLASDEAAIIFGGTNNTSGNDSNTVTNSYFQGSDNMIACNGNPLHPNRGLAFRKNFILDVYETGIAVKNGTTATTIDSNTIVQGTVGGGFPLTCKGIAFTHLSDTNYITNNIFNYSIPHVDSERLAIQLNPATTSPANSYCLIANNYFGYTSSYGWNGIEAYPIPTNDYGRRMAVVEMTGDGPIHAGFYHNTMRFSRNYSPDSSFVAHSVFFRYSATNGANDVQVLNNLFLNQRAGGIAGSEHLALQLLSTNGITTDYNTYSSGATIRTGNTLHSSFSAYRTAFSSRDIHSNDANVVFDAQGGDVLSASMYNNPDLQGTLLSLVPADRMGHTRTFPYKGCYEITAACSTGFFGGLIYASPNIACAGKNIWLYYRATNNNTGVFHQWQRRSTGATPFTDIPGATGTELLIAQTDTTIYRMKDSCVGGSGLVVYSNPLRVTMRPSGDIGGITETHTGSTYQFVLSGTTVNNHIWLFGDGPSVTLSGPVQTHTYATPGAYTVTVISTEGCMPDTVTIRVYVNTTGIHTPVNADAYRVYPNPASHLLSLEAPDQLKEIALTDQMGRTLWIKSVRDHRATVDISHIPAGYYYLRIISTGGALCKPVTIVH